MFLSIERRERIRDQLIIHERKTSGVCCENTRGKDKKDFVERNGVLNDRRTNDYDRVDSVKGGLAYDINIQYEYMLDPLLVQIGVYT